MVDLKQQVGGSRWRKVKMALGFPSCFYAPQTREREEQEEGERRRPRQLHSSSSRRSGNISGAAASSSPSTGLPPRSSTNQTPFTNPTPSSSSVRLSKSGPLSKSGKRTCAICLTSMKAGQGQAIFTAECSHSFHFQCITSNVKHGNQICPVCRAKWTEVPFQSPNSDNLHGRPRINSLGRPRQPNDDAWMNNIIRRVPPPRADTNHHVSTHRPHTPEPAAYDDDEPVQVHDNLSSSFAERCLVANGDVSIGGRRSMEIRTYPEFPAVSKLASHKDFSVLIHLKAPPMSEIGRRDSILEESRAPIDLVTVLDTSGSMAGTKLALLKQAMGFVIQHLGPTDRLSVIVFSSSARRLFPLRCMTESGKREALQAINYLVSNGGTDIAEGLRKGAKVLLDRKWKNPVCSIILLSDGQDTYTFAGLGRKKVRPDYKSLLPSVRIPVHTFGFGVDHDAAAMHSIAETSGGTFSFIEAEAMIQDAFAQCIGGLLSVVAQELLVIVNCVDPSLQIESINAGSYTSSKSVDARTGSIEVGDLYAEEERDILVTMDIPADNGSGNELLSLLDVKCIYKDPITKEIVNLEGSEPVKIHRPEADVRQQQQVSIEVDRQKNRVHAAKAMSEAQSAAENGDLSRAVSVLESCRKELSETASVRAGDRPCGALCSELREMQERMANRQVYETSGRAYVLSGLSSHSWQRATARGDSTVGTSLVQSYQTPSMVDMVTRSQTMILGNPPASSSSSSQRRLRPTLSFPATTVEPR
ncbi:unnamed protein product [Linum trigynum]|uniref:Uncharacterized protein n=1 Tax=Linum trigynum TaxID=586398 RepID=A0AAV2G3C7_9ROSI